MNPGNRQAPGHELSGILKILALVAFLAALASLVLLNNESQKHEVGTPAMLRIGVLPDQSPDILRRRFSPFLEYLSASLDIPVELEIPDSYAHLLELFHDRKVDLAYFGGYSFVRARQMDQAIPLVMRLIDTRFTSVFIVNPDIEAQTLEDLQGKRLGFGSQLSTSGHLMPRYFLQQRNIEPEEFFSNVEYSGAHDKTTYWVRDAEVDVGVVNATTFQSMLKDNRIRSGQVRILWETPPYADYVWAIRPVFGESLRLRIRNAFLALSPDVDEHSRVLKELNALGYVPADPARFSGLEAIIEKINHAASVN